VAREYLGSRSGRRRRSTLPSPACRGRYGHTSRSSHSLGSSTAACAVAWTRDLSRMLAAIQGLRSPFRAIPDSDPTGDHRRRSGDHAGLRLLYGTDPATNCSVAPRLAGLLAPPGSGPSAPAGRGRLAGGAHHHSTLTTSSTTWSMSSPASSPPPPPPGSLAVSSRSARSLSHSCPPRWLESEPAMVATPVPGDLTLGVVSVVGCATVHLTGGTDDPVGRTGTRLRPRIRRHGRELCSPASRNDPVLPTHHAGIGTLVALLILREESSNPCWLVPASPNPVGHRSGSTRLDMHYQNLQSEMRRTFRTLGLAVVAA